MDADKIGLSQKLVERQVGRVIFGFFLGRHAIDIIVEDIHIEAAGAPGHDFTDAPGSNQAERRMMDLRATEEQRTPAGILAGAQETLSLWNAARRCHE